MKKLFTFLVFLCVLGGLHAQWSPSGFQGKRLRSPSSSEEFFKLNIDQLRAQLSNAQESGQYATAVTINVPVLGGKMERFKVYRAPVMVQELEAQYQLGSYAGVGIDDPSKFIRFSVAPNDFQSMIIKPGGSEFIEPANTDKTVYRVFPKSKPTGSKAFECTTSESAFTKSEIEKLYKKGESLGNNASNFAKNSDKKYRTLRLALSVTGEYTQYFGGVAGAMTAINATLTRVNGVFEKDFALHLNLQNFPAIIYANPATDPYSPAANMNNWNAELQNTLTTVVGNANYDIGHLFGASGGGGNAGCIGCICVNPTASVPNGKGSGYTSPADGIPQGDNFDIDYVAHEMGHQFGGNHTFSHGLEGAGVNVEPGSGSTIMGYAGITGASTDVQAHSDAYFQTVSINQIQTNLISKACDVETAITNNPPVIAALSTYTIPKGTAFVLTGSATDPENDPMTYVWEEIDNATVTINNANLGNTTSGASFRSIAPSTNPTRYFPRLSSVLNGVLNNANNLWEAVSTVARQQKFAFTVRDNNAVSTQQQTQTATQIINVSANGPFKVTSTTVYNTSTSPVTWDVVGTDLAPFNSPNVKIDYTADNGATWVLLSNSTPNDGSEPFQFTGVPTGATVKIRVSSIGNVFYAIGAATVATAPPCTSAAPTNVVVSFVTPTTALVTWSASANATYNLQYSVVGSGTWTAVNGLATNSYTIPGLTPGVNYAVQVQNVCTGVPGSFSTALNFTTPTLVSSLPYVQPFTTTNDFTYVGTQTNKWYYGSAAGNPANAIYISNDNGVTNAYNNTSATVSHAYKDLIIPAGTTLATFGFDWRAVGESNYDYLRVWLVPATYAIPVNTQITAAANRIQVGGGDLNLQSTWQTYFNPTLNIGVFAGQTMRLVFEWRNDGSVGTNPPAAVDNINFLIPTCQVPTNLQVSAIGTTTATISWTAANPVPAQGYQYYLTTTNTPPTPTTIPTGNVATTSQILTPLTPNTTYYWWVRSKCSGTDTSYWMAGPSFTTGQIPATMPYQQPFTGPNDFTFVNTNQTNKWFYGSAAGNPANSIYISDDNGVTNNYSNSLSVVQAYRDILVPAGTTAATPAILSFDWRANGESIYDYFRVWLVPVSYTPVAGTQITALAGQRIQIAANFNLQSTWQNYINTNVNLAPYAGNTVRVVFEWRNDGSVSNQPPAAIDNINLLIPTCKVPLPLAPSAIASTTATISWTAPVPAPAGGYGIYISTTNTPPTSTTVPTYTTTATSYNLTALLPNTTYYWWVKAICSGTDSSIWMPGLSFTTAQIPASFPYVQTFPVGGPNDFTFVNGSQANKWVLGSATGNPPNSIYISNDNGVTNAYNMSSTSVVHAYRDIQLPATPITNAIFKFDWKAQGESSYDYFKVWLVRTNFVPVAGTQITALAGQRVQVAGNFNGQTNWQNYNNQNLNLTAFAGTIVRLVFEWTNDSSGGTNPPAAIDNVQLVRCSNTAPVVTVNPITHNSATLTWPQDLGGATYTIRYRVVGTSTWLGPIAVPAAPLGSPTNTFVFPNNLSPVTMYEVEIAAICDTNNIGPYTHVEFQTRCDPAPPTGLTVNNITSNSAVVSWDPVLSATYVLEYREVGTTTWTTVNLPGTTYTINGLLPYHTYEVHIATICSGSQNPFTTPKVFTTLPTCDMAPIGLTVTNLTTTSAQVDWNAFAGATYILRYREVGFTNWTVVNLTTNTYNLTGLTEQTQYEIQVVNVCNGTPQTWTQPYVFTTPTIVYCASASHNSTFEHISNVNVKPNGKPEMNNDSGASNYTDYTTTPSKFIELVQGSTGNVISVSKKWTPTAYDEAVTVWIDFNRDGIFGNNERILVSGPSQTTPVTATFSVPSNAYVSLTNDRFVVMRVSMQRNTAPANCGDIQFGEVEDYKVRISKPFATNIIDSNQINIYPNPTKNILYISKVEDGAKYKIYNAIGQLVKGGVIVANKIDVSTLINGVYVIDVQGQNESAQKKFIKE